MTFGTKIQLRRIELGISQREFSKKIGICFHSVGRIERDEGFPHVQTFAKICAVLSLSPEYLLGEMIDQYKDEIGVYAEPDKYQHNVFFDNLQEECRKRNTTITGILRACKLSTGNIRTWKSGVTPYKSTIKKISKCLGVTPEYLLEKH